MGILFNMLTVVPGLNTGVEYLDATELWLKVYKTGDNYSQQLYREIKGILRPILSIKQPERPKRDVL